MKRLLIVRHGESVWNAEGRIQGQSGSGLSPAGHEQAEHLAVALRDRYRDAMLVSSDLERTVETVAPLAAALGVEPRLEPRLRERHFGSWEGRLRDEVRLDDAGRWDRWLQGEDVVAEVGGESADDFGDRAGSLFRDLIDWTPDGGVTIAMSHGGTIWHGTHRLLAAPTPSFAGVDNAAVAAFLVPDGDHTLLERWNDVGHLPAELRTGAIRRVTSEVPRSAVSSAPHGR